MAAAGGPSEEADPSEASSEVLMVLGRVVKDDETDEEIIYVRGGQGNDLPIEGLPKEIDRAASTDITAEESPRGRDSESSGQLEPRSPWMVSDDPGKTTLSKVSLEPQVPEDDDNSPCEDHSKGVRDFHRGVCTYFFACVVVIGSLTAITTMVWSSMGVGEDVLQWTQDNDWLWYPLTFLYLLIFILLYLFDFFLPPHLPGQHLLLWHGDVFVGRGLLLFAVLIFLTSFFFITVDRPEMPLIVMVSLHPTFIILVWFVLVREKSPKGGKEGADDHLLVFTAITAAFWRTTCGQHMNLLDSLSVLVAEMRSACTCCIGDSFDYDEMQLQKHYPELHEAWVKRPHWYKRTQYEEEASRKARELLWDSSQT